MPSVGRQWRSIAELSDDPDFIARAQQEFPALAASLGAPLERRRALKIMAAALALGGLGGCDDGMPGGTLIPAVIPPPNIIPGLPNFYSTANLVDGYATGVVVEHSMGRPIKVEGNPRHPASLGATDVFAQAEVLDFYDPDRAAAIAHAGAPSSEQVLLTALAAQREQIGRDRGHGLRILTGTVTSPTLAAQLAAILARYPDARWHQWQAVTRHAVRAGAVRAYGRPVDTIYHLDAADVILAIDSDLLSSTPGHIRYARDFAGRRNPSRTQAMSRLYAVEPTPTLTGAVADHRFVADPRALHDLMAALADGILRRGTPASTPNWVGKVIADIEAHRGRALVHAGPEQPAEIHALLHAINEALDGRGTTFDLVEPAAYAAPAGDGSLDELVADMREGRVDTLLILDGNPVYAAPGALGFSDALKRVRFSLTMALAPDETARATSWFVPLTHSYETWSDARAFDGTATVLQPQALPLYGGWSVHRLLGLLLDASPASALELVQETWRTRFGSGFEQTWHDALAAGIVAGTAGARTDVALHGDVAQLAPPAPPDHPITVLFRPDPHLWDGRHANNAWLQELPRPLTKLTWDNPLLISPALARKTQLENGDCAELAIGAQTLRLPVWTMPGQAAECVTALMGFGRDTVGTIGQGVGYNVAPLMGRDEPAALRKVEGSAVLACTDHHNLIFDRAGEFVRHGPLSDFIADPRFLHDKERQPSLYRMKPPGPAAWAMSIDLNACIGCNACVIACQAENNIPVVGKQQVVQQREMHWLRIDRYYAGTPDAPESFFQPMLCMHCEQAPCEVVCPVGATVHDAEGLNVMVYNRCVGTRFCSNNCPYKVRRFNYFDFAKQEHRPPAARNPDVSVRARGVMEKCTFCLQRIAEARIIADRDNRPLPEVRTACQAACPTRAFTFGNMADPESTVAKRKQSPLDYALLDEQNTRPRVTYEARIENRNPAIGGEPT